MNYVPKPKKDEEPDVEELDFSNRRTLWDNDELFGYPDWKRRGRRRPLYREPNSKHWPMFGFAG
jgi:hypothetical protein